MGGQGDLSTRPDDDLVMLTLAPDFELQYRHTWKLFLYIGECFPGNTGTKVHRPNVYILPGIDPASMSETIMMECMLSHHAPPFTKPAALNIGKN
jgi:hypothetical protein